MQESDRVVAGKRTFFSTLQSGSRLALIVLPRPRGRSGSLPFVLLMVESDSFFGDAILEEAAAVVCEIFPPFWELAERSDCTREKRARSWRTAYGDGTVPQTCLRRDLHRCEPFCRISKEEIQWCCRARCKLSLRTAGCAAQVVWVCVLS